MRYRLGLIFLVGAFCSTFSNANEQETWRTPESSSIVVMQLDSGRVIIELAPQFAPRHVLNIKQLISDGYFDGTAIIRSQDNYVVQWGDVDADTANPKSIGRAKANLKVEFFRDTQDIDLQLLESRDAYAEKVGFVDGLPVASDGQRAWLVHCYGMVGVSRGVADNSGNGSGLYVVTGHSPRHLDRNVTLVGRVVEGMPLLSSLPRGSGSLGFFETPEQYIPIETIKLASALGVDVAYPDIMNTNSEAFKEHVANRTTRSDEWFLDATNKIELCNVGVPSQ